MRSSPRINDILPPSIYEQPHAAGALRPESASSLPQSSSPAQREPPIVRINNIISFFPQSSSPAQRELPQNQPTPSSLNGDARRHSGSSSRNTTFLQPIMNAAPRSGRLPTISLQKHTLRVRVHSPIRKIIVVSGDIYEYIFISAAFGREYLIFGGLWPNIFRRPSAAGCWAVRAALRPRFQVLL